MGKYLKKPKFTAADVVALMEVSQSSLGVRTRAKTLALQKLQASTTPDTPPPPHEMSYLQLRSRKLEKPPLQQNPNPRLLTSRLGGSGSVRSGSSYVNAARAFGDSQIHCDFGSEEASFGENNIDFDGRERGTRESTPCSFIRDSNDNIAPGSITRPTNQHASNRNMQRIMPSAQEIEEFFALHAQEQQRLFSEKYINLNLQSHVHVLSLTLLTLSIKGRILNCDNECRYNFDIVNEKPLEGRYEWVRVQP
ncbi:hypothetical protein SSX86_026740 [Deinandra increscens subsp. villosa]|uniref:Cyclin-dependent kinase inhibitor domain-containing protein n=1 Tax=Deinandra increscens subsp. villosa TaxID=3103831 RepID=A0AAP0CKE9_9ASTR